MKSEMHISKERSRVWVRIIAVIATLCPGLLFIPTTHAQHKGQPGKFDFYLLNLSWAPEFCSIQGTSPECTGAVHYGFIVHGLWPQNNDGTCTTLSPESFFANEHRAFHQVHIPPLFQSLHSPEQMSPSAILDLFVKANPTFPKKSIAVSCGRNHLTAVEVCLSKSLQPISCQGLHSCRAGEITVDPPL
jgi:ribonuclease T2